MKKGFFILVLNLITFLAFSQVEVTFPVNRLVFQRDNNNRAVVFIGGTYNEFCDRIDARLIPIQGGSQVDWTVISNNPQNGVFSGAVAASGGWYRLEVRTMRSGSVGSTSSIEKVGVGEVFLISGQSNAQGYLGYGQQGAQDDRVNTITNFYSAGNQTPVYPEFNKLEANTRIAPKGDGAWCWGQLGDKLVSKLNVPVLFLNAAWEGLSIGDFKVSANGGSGRNVFSGYVAPAGYPYNSIREIINYYVNMLGVRSVLWHQGETDNWISTSTNQYVEDLRYVMDRTRQDSNKNIAWVISRVSRFENRTYQPVIDAQNIVINTASNAFAGPETDQIQDRHDGTHFSTQGLSILADYWNNSLNTTFFQNSQPVMARDPLVIDASCDPSNAQPVRLNAGGSYSAYQWNTGNNGSSLNILNGTYQAKAFDQYGNAFFSPRLNYFRPIVSGKPQISVNGPTTFCEGKSVTLSSSYDFGNTWSNNSQDRNTTVSAAGSYSVSHRNVYGCVNNSDAVEVKNNPLPRPVITALGKTDICSDTFLQLESNIKDNIQWNTGQTSGEISVNNPGAYTVKATNEFGCENTSPAVTVKVYSAPSEPSIFKNGAYTIESLISGDTLNVNYEWRLENNLLNNTNRNLLKARQTGNYSLNLYKNYTLADNSVLKCVSPVTPVLYFLIDPADDGISMYPNPVVDDRLTIETLEDIDQAHISIYDISGRFITSYFVALFDAPKRLDVSFLQPGNYLVHLKNNRYSITKRIIKI